LIAPLIFSNVDVIECLGVYRVFEQICYDFHSVTDFVCQTYFVLLICLQDCIWMNIKENRVLISGTNMSNNSVNK